MTEKNNSKYHDVAPLNLEPGGTKMLKMTQAIWAVFKIIPTSTLCCFICDLYLWKHAEGSPVLTWLYDIQ